MSTREQMNIVIVGHVDHGKSTLVGRLLADTGALPDGKLEHVQAICERQGKVFEYAFLLDALEAEQDQGITIDSARCFFKTPKRDVIIIDAPGHIEFLKNMISGAARAEAAVLLIDAHEGVQENSRRHGYMLGLLGIRQVIVAVNKMDLVDCDQATFDAVEEEYRAFLAEIGLVPQRFIPISARDGDNVATHSQRMAWYTGPTVLQAVDLFAKAAPLEAQPFRLPVQDVYKFNQRGDDRRIVAGRVASGQLSVGDRVIFSPSNKSSTVATIESFNTPTQTTASSPDHAGVTLTEQIFVARGEIMSCLDHRPEVSTRFRANIVWLARKPMLMETDYKLKLGTTEISVRIHELTSVIDASELSNDRVTKEIRRHEVAELVLETKRPIAFDTIDRFASTARFVIVDDYEIAGGGIIVEAVANPQAQLRRDAQVRDFEWVPGEVSAADRVRRNGYHPALVLLTGDAGVGKAPVARRLERRLFDQGLSVYLLDARNVYVGVDRDLTASMHKDELVRRYAEVAHLFLDAGMLVISTSNTFALADHAAIETLVAPTPVIHVHIGAYAPEADLVLPPVSDIEQTTTQIVAALDAYELQLDRPPTM